jgi:hypothetical protein
MRGAVLAIALVTATAGLAPAQDLSASQTTCFDEVVPGGQKGRLIADFITRDGRIFTCLGTLMIPDSSDLRPRIDEARCSLTRSAMPGGEITSTSYFTQRGAAPGVCGLDLTMQANLKTGKARFCAFRSPTELCKIIPLIDGR